MNSLELDGWLEEASSCNDESLPSPFDPVDEKELSPGWRDVAAFCLLLCGVRLALLSVAFVSLRKTRSKSSL
jgi:hypothetical protein